MRAYDRIADWYAAHRSPAIGVQEVLALLAGLPRRARILDLGCGDGLPIARALLDSGYEVFGIDSSAKMVARFRVNCRGARVRRETIQSSRFFGRRFDAIVAWGVMFHLGRRDQERVIRKVARHLLPGGRFLFTAAQRHGVATGTMGGVRFRYRSLGERRYRELLAAAGLLPAGDRDDGHGNHVFMARSPRRSSS
jgi:SAM-dependent methyltransferase